jgi:peptide-methionine (S)-S-oxide reductase
LETATFAGGCFWCIESIFSGLRGVQRAVPGYMGGQAQHPSYEQVCTGRTGHAEAVQVTFDPKEISYKDLLEVFFAMHDPTTPNRQGGDVGTQYRSAVFYHSEAQRQAAEELIASLGREAWWEGARVVTEVLPAAAFYEAEDYHHEYFLRNPERGYCRAVIAPKMQKLRKKFAERLKESAQ